MFSFSAVLLCASSPVSDGLWMEYQEAPQFLVPWW